MSRLFRWLMAAFCFAPLFALSVEVSHLYVARVDATLQLESGLSKGFEQVVVRVSGQRSALENELIKQQGSRLRDYISQYGYIEDDGARWLEISFNQEAMQRLLRQANLPIWGSLRPVSLVWLVQEQDYKRELVGESSSLFQQSQLRELIQQRGVPIMLPLLDLDDISLVDASDVWGQFTGSIAQASARYGADQMVLAKLYKLSATEHQLQWRMYSLDQSNGVAAPSWFEESLTGDIATLLPEWWQQMSDALGGRYATRVGITEADNVQIVIYNLTDLSRVLGAESSLKQMAMVSQVDLFQIDGSQAVFTIHLLGAAADF